MQVLVSQPADMPLALLNGLCVFFASTPDITTAYFAQVSGSFMKNEPHFIVGVATNDRFTQWQKLLTDLGPIIKAANAKLGVEVEPIDPDNPDDPWFSLLKTYEPFYTRTSS